MKGLIFEIVGSAIVLVGILTVIFGLRLEAKTKAERYHAAITGGSAAIAIGSFIFAIGVKLAGIGF